MTGLIPPGREHAAWEAEARRLQVQASRLVTSLFAGDYRSVFRGRGMEFLEVREYQPGDDVRGIDWNVTARAGRPFVKQFIEEREMTVMLLLDLSASLTGASPRGTPARTAAQVCALLAFAAARSNDRVGLLAFTDRIETFLAPAKGPRHARRLVADVARLAPAGRGTDLAGALDYLGRVQRRGAIVFLISDFLAGGYRLPLAAASRRHEMVAVAVGAPADPPLPRVGVVRVVDPETGVPYLLDTRAARVREAWHRQSLARRAELKQATSDAGVDLLEIPPGMPPGRALARFFAQRRKRRSMGLAP